MRAIDEARKLFQGDLIAIPRPDCLRLLAISRIGRVACNSAGGPLVVPVNGRAHGTDVYLRVREGSLLAEALRDGHASYEIDGFDDFHQVGWSVLVRGRVSWISADELPEHRSEWPSPWVTGVRDVWVRISGDDIAGRRLIP